MRDKLKKKIVIIISGPSGSGKSTLIKYILENFKDIGTTVSCTTRPMRNQEKEGIDYYFINDQEFQNYIDNQKFIEYTNCYKNRYGTLKESINQVLNTKKACILDVDFNGALSILANKIDIFDYISILILPPSIKSLKSRLLNRCSENEETLNIRLLESFNPKEIASYDYVLINKDLEKTKESINLIIKKNFNLF